ncbi:MAG: DNA polymerase III subunit psi [bacterium]|nr:DNA polymerase III subunit psi [bacterium]
MFNNLTLYYLNQMGIIPWVDKEGAKTTNVDPIAVKLILITSKMSNKTQIFFNRVLDYLNLAEKDLSMITLGENNKEAQKQIINTMITKAIPQAVLILGLNKDLLTPHNVQCPIISVSNPEYFMDNPTAKKSLFQELQYIKNLVG